MSRLWAEDGTVFLRDAVHGSFISTLTKPYAGYLHVVPRIIAEIASWLPLSAAAAVFAIAAAAVRAAVALVVFRASAGHLRSPTVRTMLAAAVVLLPVAGFETLDNAANLHWFLTFGAFWALLWRPSRRWECVLAASLVAAAMLSDPLTWLFAPLVFARLWALPRRSRHQIVSFAYLVAALLQGVAVVNASRGPHESFGVVMILHYYAVRIVLGSVGGVTNTAWIDEHWHRPAVLLAAAAVGLLIVPALAAGGRRRWLAAAAGAASVAEYLVAWHSLGALPDTPINILSGMLRHNVLPLLLLLSAIAAGLDGPPVRGRGLWRGALSRGVLVRLVVGLVFISALPADFAAAGRFWDRPGSSGPPTWQGSVAVAQHRCLGGAAPDVHIPAKPYGWTVDIACAYLLEHG